MEALLERERGDNRALTVEGAEMAAALAGLEARLEAAQEQLAEVRCGAGFVDGLGCGDAGCMPQHW